MMRRLVVVALVLMMAGAAYADAMRPLRTKENKFPEQGHLEVGATVAFTEVEDEDEPLRINDRDIVTTTPYARFGLHDQLAAYVAVPFIDIDRDVGDDDRGTGDIAVGLEAKVYEDIFRYPWVVPHAEFRFDTGDEDDGLGRGEQSLMVGVAVGTVRADQYTFIADVRYEILEDNDNIASIAGSLIWDVSDQFSVLAEATMSDEEIGEDNDHPSFFQGGLCYKPVEEMLIGVYGGGGKNTEEDVVATLKVAYTF